MELKEELKKAEKFIENTNKESRVLIIAHRDGDGVISTAIITQLLKEKEFNQTNIKNIFILSRGKEAQEKIRKEAQKTKAQTIIFLDYTPNNEVYRENTEEGIRTLTIDHHPQLQPNEGGVYVNPWQKEVLPSAGAMCHQLYTQAGGTKNTKPWAIISAYGDTRLKETLKQIKLTPKEEEIYIPSGRLDWDLLEVVRAMAAASFNNQQAQQLLELTLKSIEDENPSLIAEEKYGKAKKIFKSRNKAYREMIEETRKAEVKIYEESKLVLAIIRPKRNIKNMAVDHLRLKYPDYTVAVASNKEKNYYFSFRAFEKDLSKVVPRACEGIQAQGGGHSNAAGGKVKEKDLNTFIENLKEQLRSN